MRSVATLAIAYLLSQFSRSVLAVLAPELTRDLQMTGFELSVAAGLWFAAFATMQFPVGWALDRFGPRRTVTAGLLVVLAGAMVFATAKTGTAVAVAMALIGMGCAPQMISAVFIFGRIFPPRRFAVMTSWFVAFGLTGGILSSAPLAFAVEAIGWRAVMGTFGAIALILAFVVFRNVTDPPVFKAEGGTNGSLLDLLKLKALWPIMPMSLVAYAPGANLRGLWAGPYLSDVHGLDTIAVGHATLAMTFGLILGSLAFGPLDVLLRTRKWVPFVGISMTGFCVTGLALFGAGPLEWALALLVAAVFFAASYSIVMAHARAFMPAPLLGRGVTLMNFFSIGGAGLAQFASGAVFEVAGGRAAGIDAFHAVFVFYALILVAGLTIYATSRDRPPERDTPALAD